MSEQELDDQAKHEIGVLQQTLYGSYRAGPELGYLVDRLSDIVFRATLRHLERQEAQDSIRRGVAEAEAGIRGERLDIE
jgi:hypothetical protein